MKDSETLRKMKQIYNVVQVPLSLLDRKGTILYSFPELPFEAVNSYASTIVLEDFTAQGCNASLL